MGLAPAGEVLSRTSLETDGLGDPVPSPRDPRLIGAQVIVKTQLIAKMRGSTDPLGVITGKGRDRRRKSNDISGSSSRSNRLFLRILPCKSVFGRIVKANIFDRFSATVSRTNSLNSDSVRSGNGVKCLQNYHGDFSV